MTARLMWKDDGSARPRSRRRTLRFFEWVFLIVGLLALDCFMWITTSSVLYQAYEDWAFDQTLRGLTPSVGGFVNDEARWLWSGGGARAPKAEAPLAPDTALNPDTALKSEPLSEAPPAMRSVIGRLEIPRLKLSVMVREGADEGTLRRAVGHIPGTALPGNMGNVGLAGHRDTFFRALQDIREDDTIEFQTTGGTYHYIVKSTKIVTPRDVSVLAASGGENLTLVTCYPFYYVGSAPKRFIVHASQVAAIQRNQPQPGS
jgi:sortase A